MKRLLLPVVALVLAFTGVSYASSTADAAIPDQIKTQRGFYDYEGEKVRYIIEPRVSSEVHAVRINYKPARQARDGSWYRVMESQKFGANHWVYTQIETEAVVLESWVRYRNLYPQE